METNQASSFSETHQNWQHINQASYKNIETLGNDCFWFPHTAFVSHPACSDISKKANAYMYENKHRHYVILFIKEVRY